MKATTLIAGALAATLTLTAVSVAAENRGGPRASFEELDANSDGEVTQAEIAAFAAARFAAADTDGDGSLSTEELIAARSADASERLERRVARFVERADANGNGTIEADEMGNSERAAARFERMDTDGSGSISQEEADAAKERRADRGGRGDRGDRGGDRDG